MRVPQEGYDDLLLNFRIDESEYEHWINEAGKVLSYVNSKLGNRNFWQVSESELSFIYAITSAIRPRVVAETGVGPGTTSYAFLSALMKHGGELVSFDLGQPYGDEKAHEPVGFVVPESLKNSWHLIVGDTESTLPENIARYGKPDIFMHDSDHTYSHVTFELETVFREMNPNFLIIVDNYDWTNAAKDFAEKNGLVLSKVADDMCCIYRKRA